MQSTDPSSLWTITANLKRRKSPNGINLVFVPGQNVVLELNEIAGDIIEAFCDGPVSYDRLCSTLRSSYEVEDEAAFLEDVDQVLERFVTHRLIVPMKEGAL